MSPLVRDGGSSARGGKAPKPYWDATYRDGVAARVLDSNEHGLRGHARRAHARFFRATFTGTETGGRELLECGCGRSPFLPYFAREFGFRVSGIDFSEQGCTLARNALADAGVQGSVFCADFFAPPTDLHDRYDVVVSFGVVEHFPDTAGCLTALARFLRPGGLMITSVPNMAGLGGLLQKIFSRSVFDKHVALDPPALAAAHAAAGLEVHDSRCFQFVNLGVVNINEVRRGTAEHALKQVGLTALRALTAGCWLLEELLGDFPPNGFTSPYVVCTAKRPGNPCKAPSSAVRAPMTAPRRPHCAPSQG